MVSASSRPGSRRWVCRSTSPGRATSPSASMVSAPDGASSTSTPASSTYRSRCLLAEQRGSLDHQRHQAIPPRVLPGQQVVEHGHPDRQAAGDLLQHDRLGRIGGVGGDLEATVHRSRVADRDVRLEQGQPVAGQAVADGVLPRAREERAATSARAGRAASSPRRPRAAPRRCRTTSRSRPRPTRWPIPLGISVGGATTVTRAPRRVRHCTLDAEDPAVGQVADDRDVAALERAEVALERVGVEQRLGRVLVQCRRRR